MSSTLDQVIDLVSFAVSCFPSMQDKSMGPTVKAWEKLLGDLPHELLEAALKKVLLTAKYFPSPGEIREAAADLSCKHPSPTEALLQISRMMRSYGYQKYDEGIRTLSPLVAEAVKEFGWYDLHNSNRSTINKEFNLVYNNLLEKQRSQVLLSPDIRQLAGSERMIADGN